MIEDLAYPDDEAPDMDEEDEQESKSDEDIPEMESYVNTDDFVIIHDTEDEYEPVDKNDKRYPQHGRCYAQGLSVVGKWSKG